MKIFITNNRTDQFSTDILNKFGGQVRVLIQPGETVEVINIDPFRLNLDKAFRRDIFEDGDLSYYFECEDDDLVCFLGHFVAGDLSAADKGAIIAGDGTLWQKFAPGADGELVVYDSAQTLGLGTVSVSAALDDVMIDDVTGAVLADDVLGTVMVDG